MVCKEKVKVINSLGLHARPASMLVQVASKYNSNILVSKDEMKVNAKSIMGVMMLAAEKGAEVVIEAVGDDAKEAVASIKELFLRKFDEE
jgi:phosphocarrier protein